MARLRRWLIPLILLVGLVVAAHFFRTRRLAGVEPRLAPAPAAATTAPANAAALALEDLAAKLGVGLTPEGSQRPHVATTLGELLTALNRHVDGQLARPALPLDPPPPEVERFLSEHAADLAAVETALLSGETPSWESAPSHLHGDLPVNMLGHLSLHRLLMLRALEAVRQGQAEGAARALEASHRLRQSLPGAQSPLASNLLTLVTKLEAGTLRKLDQPLPLWPERLAPGPLLEARAAAFAAVARGLFDSARDGDRDALLGWYARKDSPFYRYQIDRVVNPIVVRPLIADAAVRMQDLIESLGTSDPCVGDADAIEAHTRESAKLNPLAARFVPDHAAYWLRTGRVALDLELTRLVLRYKDHRRAAPGAALDPAAVTAALGDLGSEVCRGRKWTVAVDAAAGTVKLALDGTPSWTPATGLVLPLSYEEYAAAEAPAPEPAAAPAPSPEPTP